MPSNERRGAENAEVRRAYLWFIRVKRMLVEEPGRKTSGTFPARARQKGPRPYHLRRRIAPRKRGARADATAKAEGAQRNLLVDNNLGP